MFLKGVVTMLKKALLFMACMIFLASSVLACDMDTQVYKCEITCPPLKTEYPAGYEGDIDLTGIQIAVVQQNGRRKDHSIGTFLPFSKFETSVNDVDALYWDDSNVDYTTPGEYTVYIYYLNPNKPDDSFKIRVYQGE